MCVTRFWRPEISVVKVAILVKIYLLKGAVSRDFLAFFSWIEPMWAPDKQIKMFSLKNSFSQMTSRRLTLFFKMNVFRETWGFVEKFAEIQSWLTLRGVLSSPIFSLQASLPWKRIFFNIWVLWLFKGLACQQILTPWSCSVSLRGVEFFEVTFEYLRENDFLKEAILICLSWAQMGWVNEEKKSREAATLK